ncbi:MAG: hypothetical protein V4601_00900 [Pseudomonadota bacterium]
MQHGTPIDIKSLKTCAKLRRLPDIAPGRGGLPDIAKGLLSLGQQAFVYSVILECEAIRRLRRGIAAARTSGRGRREGGRLTSLFAALIGNDQGNARQKADAGRAKNNRASFILGLIHASRFAGGESTGGRRGESRRTNKHSRRKRTNNTLIRKHRLSPFMLGAYFLEGSPQVNRTFIFPF